MPIDSRNFEPASVGGFFAAREDGHENDMGVRTAFLVFRDRYFDAIGDFIGAILSAIVGADHQDDDFWVHPVNLSVVQPPEDVLNGVRAPAEVGRVPAVEMLFPVSQQPGGSRSLPSAA